MRGLRHVFWLMSQAIKEGERMILLRDMLDFNTMLALYLIGKLVARHGWEQPIDRNSGYIFSEDDQRADDWMVVKEENDEES